MASGLTKRRLAAILLVALLLPTTISGLSHGLAAASTSNSTAGTVDPGNLTVVTTQGGDHNVRPDAGRMVGIRTPTNSVAWVNDRYLWYYDVDPLNNETLQFIAHERQPSGDLDAFVVTWNWVENETLHRFEVPKDTHDVDRIGLDQYAVADQQNDRAYVYDVVRGKAVWKYQFRKHFPGPPEAGGAGDYTHLNEIDLLDGGETILLSPRNFNRVIAVDRTTKAVEWTLGAQDNTTILDRQHDPVVLDGDPLTVLVADSENNRVVEYRRTDGEWEATWSYSQGLNWPRAVQRLPNGNTLITDSGNDRVIEVTPGGDVVWEYNTADRFPYDVERIASRDEPGGPTIASLERTAGAAVPPMDSARLSVVDPDQLSVLDRTYRIAAWLLPIWIGKLEFVTLVAASLLAIGWVSAEVVGGVWRRFATDVYGEGLFDRSQ